MLTNFLILASAAFTVVAAADTKLPDPAVAIPGFDSKDICPGVPDLFTDKRFFACVTTLEDKLYKSDKECSNKLFDLFKDNKYNDSKDAVTVPDCACDAFDEFTACMKPFCAEGVAKVLTKVKACEKKPDYKTTTSTETPEPTYTKDDDNKYTDAPEPTYTKDDDNSYTKKDDDNTYTKKDDGSYLPQTTDSYTPATKKGDNYYVSGAASHGAAGLTLGAVAAIALLF
ncbi:hypothetical protein HDU97_008432 [Phlyctochytrium planicorne]|nr:hypothetical protein HDU97_008432 [Phlyctochytrium planicorne]